MLDRRDKRFERRHSDCDFKNDKKSENQPDYDILLSEPREEK